MWFQFLRAPCSVSRSLASRRYLGTFGKLDFIACSTTSLHLHLNYFTSFPISYNYVRSTGDAKPDATLRAAGSDFSHVARLTIYVRDFDAAQLPAIRAARDRWIDPKRPPASALIGVQALFQPDVRVEVDAIAVIPEPAGDDKSAR